MAPAQRVCVAIAAGIAYPFLLTWLYAYGGQISLLSLAAAKQLGPPATVHSAFFVVSALCWALIVGLLFGVPFGLAFRKGQIFSFWLLFVAAGALAQFIAQLFASLDVRVLVDEWSLPDVWLNLVAILAIAYLIAALRQSHAPTVKTAP